MTRPLKPSAVRPMADGVLISVHAQPGAKSTSLAGLHGDAVKIRIHAPPLDGRANQELREFLSHVLQRPQSQIELIRGDKSRSKVFKVTAISESETRLKLGID